MSFFVFRNSQHRFVEAVQYTNCASLEEIRNLLSGFPFTIQETRAGFEIISSYDVKRVAPGQYIVVSFVAVLVMDQAEFTRRFKPIQHQFEIFDTGE